MQKIKRPRKIKEKEIVGSVGNNNKNSMTWNNGGSKDDKTLVNINAVAKIISSRFNALNENINDGDNMNDCINELMNGNKSVRNDKG